MKPMLSIWNNLFARRPDTGRWSRFLHSRQWLGLPAAAEWLVCRLDNLNYSLKTFIAG